MVPIPDLYVSLYIQAPEEFFAAVTTSASMIFGIATIVIFHVSMEEERADRRRAILVVVSLTAAGIFAPPLLRPLAGYIRDEEGFECRFALHSHNTTP